MISFSLLNPCLFALVPPLLWLYWGAIAPRHRPLFITAVSSLILGMASPLFFSYVLLVAFLTPLFVRRFPAAHVRILAYAFGFLTIVFWKYIFDFFRAAMTATFDLPALFAMVGVSFMGLRITGLLLACATPGTPRPTSLECLNFLSFFPTLTAGPLESFSGFKNGYTGAFQPRLFWASCYKITFGLFKKIILLELLFQKHFGTPLDAFVHAGSIDPAAYASVEILVFAVLLFLKTLLDISAYNDLARGFAGLFGYNIINDINYPLGVRNLSDYWRNWHVSVMRWCQTHIYFPVFLWKKSILLGTFASLLVMGIWHDVEWKWFVWGLYQAAGLTILHHWNQHKQHNRVLSSAGLQRAQAVTGPLLTLGFTSMAFVIVGPDTFERSTRLIASLFGIPY